MFGLNRCNSERTVRVVYASVLSDVVADACPYRSLGSDTIRR
jgi:hypothetical protein